jgi:glycerol kinase
VSTSPNSSSSPSSSAIVISIDCGTTGVRSFAVNTEGLPIGFRYTEFTQHFPQPGWVEHDAMEIWDSVQSTLHDLLTSLPTGTTVAALGITNQRETVVAWDRTTGKPLARAIVWQDRRTAGVCDRLTAEGHLPTVRARTGLVLDPYFSGTKFRWLLDNGVNQSPNLLMGTIDDWVLWNLTGGINGGVHATDPSNASRTMLYDIVNRAWSPEMSEILGVPLSVLPEVRPSSGRFGTVGSHIVGGQLTGVPISGILGDQQSALFGQACLSTGMVKNTYGTGSFLLMNVGHTCPPPSEGLLTTVAWDLGSNGGFAYALEGAVFVTGAAIQWLRDGLGIIGAAAEIGPLASSVPDTDGVFVVPAFAGLGSPWWDPYARGTIVGITRGTGKAQIARAVVESIAYQVRDVVDKMSSVSGTTLAELRVDGGAAVMDLLLQLQADQLNVPVSRPQITETTAMGAAFAAGLAEGVWSSTADVSAAWHEAARFSPQRAKVAADKDHAQWLRAVERSRSWETP